MQNVEQEEDTEDIEDIEVPFGWWGCFVDLLLAPVWASLGDLVDMPADVFASLRFCSGDFDWHAMN